MNVKVNQNELNATEQTPSVKQNKSLCEMLYKFLFLLLLCEVYHSLQQH